jgi:hypothetical protein
LRRRPPWHRGTEEPLTTDPRRDARHGAGTVDAMGALVASAVQFQRLDV